MRSTKLLSRRQISAIGAAVLISCAASGALGATDIEKGEAG